MAPLQVPDLRMRPTGVADTTVPRQLGGPRVARRAILRREQPVTKFIERLGSMDAQRGIFIGMTCIRIRKHASASGARTMERVSTASHALRRMKIPPDISQRVRSPFRTILEVGRVAKDNTLTAVQYSNGIPVLVGDRLLLPGALRAAVLRVLAPQSDDAKNYNVVGGGFVMLDEMRNLYAIESRDQDVLLVGRAGPELPTFWLKRPDLPTVGHGDLPTYQDGSSITIGDKVLFDQVKRCVVVSITPKVVTTAIGDPYPLLMFIIISHEGEVLVLEHGDKRVRVMYHAHQRGPTNWYAEG